METWSEERRVQGQAIIADIEDKALRDMQVGMCRAVLRWGRIGGVFPIQVALYYRAPR